MAKIKNIIFDLDGTLWDTRTQISKAWNQILNKEYNISINPKQITKLMGKTNNDFINIFFDKIDNIDTNSLLKRCQNNELLYLQKNGGKLFPNAINTIKTLSKKYNLFIVSNCQAGYIETFLNYYNLNKYFKDFECFGNTNQEKSKNINLLTNRNDLYHCETCYVGDTYDDYKASKDNNIIFIHASYGFGICKSRKYCIKAINDLKVIISKLEKN